MGKVLIAYNNDSDTVLHDYFESCADEAKQICADNAIDYSSICPPGLKENIIIGKMLSHQLCFFAGHGDVDGIYNEHDEAVVSTHTTNYNFSGKGLYCVACSCAQNLYPQLRALGLKLFVGYCDVVRVKGSIEPFVNSAMAGLKSFLSGNNFQESKEKMLSSFDEEITSLDADSWEAKFLVHNKEVLVFEGDDAFVFSSLQDKENVTRNQLKTS